MKKVATDSLLKIKAHSKSLENLVRWRCCSWQFFVHLNDEDLCISLDKFIYFQGNCASLQEEFRQADVRNKKPADQDIVKEETDVALEEVRKTRSEESESLLILGSRDAPQNKQGWMKRSVRECNDELLDTWL